jgi:hypothetical protein
LYFTTKELRIGNAGKFEIYPNPASDKIIVSLYEHSTGDNYVIYTIDGKMIAEGNLEQQVNEIAVSYFSKGIYFISVNNYGLASYQKFVVE